MSDKRDLLDVLHNIVANARLVPDPAMQGMTDIYAVPCDDIEEAQRLLRGITLADRSTES